MRTSICILITGLLLFGKVTTAQNESEEIVRPHHEINLGFTDICKPKEDQSVIYYPPYYYYAKVGLDLSYIPYYEIPVENKTQYGIGYKYHFGKNAARLTFGYGNKSSESDNDQGGGSTYTTDLTASTLAYRVGFERTIIRREKYDFYLAADFIALQSDNTYETKQLSPGYQYSSKDDIEYTETGGGLSLGIRYFIHKNISFSTETRIDYTSFEKTSKNTSVNSGSNIPTSEYATKNSEEGSKTIINPFAIVSVNVHF